jgi:pimeloyl-ACP methyl ester carboxylesterase
MATEVVLFGVGDLRVDDHLGLAGALRAVSSDASTNIVPVFLLSGRMLASLPGAVAHTSDTARIVHEAILSLDRQLRNEFGTSLNVVRVNDDNDLANLPEALIKAVVHDNNGAAPESRINVHVCDLGPVDNAMGYGPFSYFSAPPDDQRIRVVPWNNNLRSEPWTRVDRLPDRFPDYESKYCSGSTPIRPVSVRNSPGQNGSARVRSPPSSDGSSTASVPSLEEVLELIRRSAGIDEARCKAEQNTGLYATHWGGLPPGSVGEDAVRGTLEAYAANCRESDKAWFEHPSYVGRTVKRNGLSLEHASMQWQLEGDGRHPVGDADNWLPGESVVRFLAAPLLLGTVSPRRVWHASTQDGFFYQSPLKRVVEAREWHRLLAARNMQVDPAYRGQGETTYKYWRYQGFLVRYAETNFSSSEKTAGSGHREGVLLVHGFGASGSQWNKAMHHLRDACSEATCQGLAPDLLGFGHSEKPSISYTAYLWDSMVGDFVKEVALPQNGWNTFVVGGNSIGGFTSMSMAASDTAAVGARQVTSSGSPGTGRCAGLVLMNSAGPLKNRQEVELGLENAKDLQLKSVAQVTALSGLPPCKPPPRPVARVFGNGLLAYLRPSIQSICKNLYPTNPGAVDDELCESISRDSLDPGAIFVMMAGAKLPTPRTANELLQADFGCAPPSTPDQVQESVFTGPVLVAQGVLDPLNDATDRMKRFGSLRTGITMDPIQAGHCPHDELPKDVATSIARWMSATAIERSMTSKAAARSGSVPMPR